MQVQIVWHDRGSDDADGHVNHPRLTKSRSDQRAPHLQEVRLRLGQNKNLDRVASANGRHQQQHNGFDGPHPEPLQGQQQQHIQSRDDDRPKQRDVEHEVESDGAA